MRATILLIVLVGCSTDYSFKGNAATEARVSARAGRAQARAAAAKAKARPATEGEAEAESESEGEAKFPVYQPGILHLDGPPSECETGFCSDIRNMTDLFVEITVNGQLSVVMKAGRSGPEAGLQAVRDATDGATRQTSLIGPRDEAWLTLAGPGPYTVKTLCYRPGADGVLTLVGGGQKSSESLRLFNVMGWSCRPLPNRESS